MLSDFTKLNTFLTVVKEKSFSKASAKLGISQPAVTQQIKFIEDYLGALIVDRKKNGIKLTNEGEHLLNIAQKIEKVIVGAEQDLLKIINKSITFSFGASIAIGNYILPVFLNNIKEKLDNDVSIKVDVSEVIIDQLLDKKIDMALIESPVFKDGIIYREWLEDEIVVISNQKLPKKLTNKNILSYKWVCRDKDSHTRKLFRECLEYAGFSDCDSLDISSVVTSPTTIIQTILHSSTTSNPTASIVSKFAAKSFVKAGVLFEAKISTTNMKRKLYIAYLKDRKHDVFIENVVHYLNTVKASSF
jgi:DNA-binding transcriptional LysR family regulator